MKRSSSFLPFVARTAGDLLVDRADRERKGLEDRIYALSEKRRVLTREADEVKRDALRNASTLDERDTQASSELEEKVQALLIEKETLERLLGEAVRRAKRLRDERAFHIGLAPWDSVALEAYRAWGELPSLPDDGISPILKGSEVEALFHERLGVSRSTYYAEYRGLLRVYHLTPFRAVEMPDGGLALPARSIRRFRREEVDALIRFLLADSG